MLSEGPEALLEAPDPSFEEELNQLFPLVYIDRSLKEGILQEEDAEPSVMEKELSDLYDHCRYSKSMDATQTQKLVGEYRLLRERIDRCTLNSPTRMGHLGRVEGASREVLLSIKVPDGIPEEFDFYIRGAISFHLGKLAEARTYWEKLLALPEDDRRNKTLCANYMLGQSWTKEDPVRAMKYFQATIDWARERNDSIGLARRAYGWLAFYELEQRDYVRAIHHYCDLLVAEKTHCNVLNVRFAAGKCFRNTSPAEKQEVVKDPLALQVVTAYMISWAPYEDELSLFETRVKGWLSALEQGPASSIRCAGADRLALAAYRAGNMEEAQRWLQLVESDSKLADWIEAKLALRHGDTQTAQRLLKGIAEEERLGRIWSQWWPHWPLHLVRVYRMDRVWGELGVLWLNDGEYLQALDAFLKGSYWVEAAYVSERVLTLEELQDYVDAKYPDNSDRWGGKLRHLLARRMVRLNKPVGVEKYFPEELQPIYKNYEQSLTSARVGINGQDISARDFCEAARLLRKHGMELAGTELEPDWFYTEGSYYFEPRSMIRYRQLGYTAQNQEPDSWCDEYQLISDQKASSLLLNPKVSDEIQRVIRHAPLPEKRFHYRYTAASLAWEAASRMLDNSTATARILWEAGSWIKNQDPEEADVFYKALVRRNPNIPLAQYADRLRWFPPADEDGNPIIKSNEK